MSTTSNSRIDPAQPGLQSVAAEPEAPEEFLAPPPFLHGLPAIIGETVHVGEFGEEREPVITVEPGDEVFTSTLGLWGGQASPTDSLDDILSIRKGFVGRGPHSLTGPIAVFGAQPGDAIGIEVLRLVPNRHGVNLVTPQNQSRGVLASRFPNGYVRHFEIDSRAGTARSDELEIPVDPFLGFVGVAPENRLAQSSVEPGSFGGNLDIAAATIGSTVWLPVQREGGHVYIGDGHAAQGDGEVNGTAIECGFDEVHVRLHLVREAQLTGPRVTRDDALVAVGLATELAQAVQHATGQMVDWLIELGVEASSAYTLCSVAAKLQVSQVVNRVVGAHMTLARRLIPVDTNQLIQPKAVGR